MTRPRIGFALGSGSARGWSHIGIIDRLAEEGIVPDIVVGSSIGALVGAALVSERLAQLRQWVEAASWRELARLLDVRLTGGGLIEGSGIVEFLRGIGISGPIESHTRKFAAVATDLSSGREIWLQSGSILDAVRASIGLPGIFSPFRCNGLWLVDGGLSNPVPVSVCRALGAEVIVAVNLNGDLLGRRFVNNAENDAVPRQVPNDFLRRIMEPMPSALAEQLLHITPKLLARSPSTPGYFDVLANSINIMQDQITRTRLAGEPPHVLLVPRLHNIGLMEFNRGNEAIAEGRLCAEEALPMLRRYL